MGWADKYVEGLKRGETVQFRPHGLSMAPVIESGTLVTVAPSDIYEVDDIVLCSFQERQYLHFIKQILGKDYLIGNNRGGINGWTTKDKIYGKLIKVEP
jgi:hypothetical protein